MAKIDLNKINNHQEVLNSAAKTLKQQFIGIDNIIDDIMENIKIWYLMPDLLTRPLIINLWGMTGVGKTDLIRNLVKLINFQDRLTEIELNHSDRSSYHGYINSVKQILDHNEVDPKKPFILLFDEIQKFYTLDNNKDLADQKYQDFWELLSDGKLSKRNKSQLNDILEEWLFSDILSKKNKKPESPTEAENPNFDLSVWEARKIFKQIRPSNSFTDLADKSKEDIIKMMQEAIDSKQAFEDVNYNQGLIFICGNIDEAYSFAGLTSETEVDADIFHSLTKKISSVDIKEALSKRFRPEQVSRFGNIHLIYPSLSKKNFQTLIQVKIDESVQKFSSKYNLSISLDQTINELIYENGVFPVQGVRPVFSTITDILEKNLTQFTFHALKNNYSKIKISYKKNNHKIVAIFDGVNEVVVPYLGRIDKVRKDQTKHFVSLISLHEAGHALVYAIEFGLVPLQLKSRIASTAAAGFTFSHHLYLTKKSIKQKINILLAGNLAERIIFGEQNVTTGAATDLEQATALAADYVRKFGFDPKFKTVFGSGDVADFRNTDLKQTNESLEELLNIQTEQTLKILNENKKALLELAQKLNQKGKLKPIEIKSILNKHKIKTEIQDENYTIITPYFNILNE